MVFSVLVRVPLRLTANGALRQRPEGTLLLKEAVGRIALLLMTATVRSVVKKVSYI